MNKFKILGKKSVGYWSALNGLEVKEIGEDYVECVSGAWNGHKQVAHCVKIRHNTKGDYIRLGGYTFYLRDIVPM